MRASRIESRHARPLPLVPRAESPPSPASSLLELQRSAGNAAVGRLLQRDTATATRPRVVELYGEKVEVADDDEKEEAARIIRAVQQHYGVQVSSQKSLAAAKKHYKDEVVGQKVLDAIKTSTWKMEELRALELALAHFAPILGEQRKQSTRSGAAQEVTSAGKLTQTVDFQGRADPGTLAEAFGDAKNVSFYDAGAAAKGDFADDSKELVGTAIHELAHDLMDYALPDWVQSLDFWEDDIHPSGKKGAEAPLTGTGRGGPSEDLAESMTFYFLEPETLKNGKGKPKGEIGNPCPTRFALVDKYVKAWKKPAAKR